MRTHLPHHQNGRRAAPIALFAVVAAGLGCDSSESEPRSDPATTGSRNDPGESRSRNDPQGPAPSAPDTEASRLARRVFEAAGGPALGRVAELRFRFVVESGGKRVADVMHRWDRRGDRDRITWTGDGGQPRDLVVDLNARSVCGTVGGEPIDDGARQKLSEEAYGRWVNDAYWLVMPLKLFDPGVELTVDEPREHEGRRFEILRLEFDDVGLTPGDRYWLFVGDDDRVRRWEMVLEGDEPPPKGMSWTDYERVGPLTLAHDHVSDDGETRVRFEDTEALAEVAEQDFAIPGC